MQDARRAEACLGAICKAPCAHQEPPLEQSPPGHIHIGQHLACFSYEERDRYGELLHEVVGAKASLFSSWQTAKPTGEDVSIVGERSANVRALTAADHFADEVPRYPDLVGGDGFMVGSLFLRARWREVFRALGARLGSYFVVLGGTFQARFSLGTPCPIEMQYLPNDRRHLPGPFYYCSFRQIIANDRSRPAYLPLCEIEGDETAQCMTA